MKYDSEAWQEVFNAIQDEINYIDEREKQHGVDFEGHSVAEWLILLEEYTNRAKHNICEFDGQRKALHNIRKVVAMGIWCMAINGVMPRAN